MSNMLPSIDKYQCKLINHILFATSQEEVKVIVDNSLIHLKELHLNHDLVLQFIERIFIHLEEFDPHNFESQQWSNIKMAKIKFKQLRELFLNNKMSFVYDAD